MPSVHVIVADGFADWEPAHALAEIRRSGQYDVTVIGFSTAPIRSMGGLRVLPERTLADVDPDDVRLLILPGGDLWESEDAYPHAELVNLLMRVHDAERPIAVICGATLPVARAGLLDARRHTSNAPEYLTSLAPTYRGGQWYEAAPAVRDRRVITASGLAPVDFAREIFAELETFSSTDATLWFDMFKHGRMPVAG